MRWLVCAAAWVAVGACSHGAVDRRADIHAALSEGRPAQARQVVDNTLAELPVGAPDKALWLLERAALSLRAGDAKQAATDLALADPMLEVLSLDPDQAGQWAAQLFSASDTLYKAPAYEKLMVNVLGMLAQASSGDLNGARVEARRLHTMDRYFEEAVGAGKNAKAVHVSKADPGGVKEAGRWLAGLVFELSGRPDIAARWYRSAHLTAHGDRVGSGAILVALKPAMVPVDGRPLPSAELAAATSGRLSIETTVAAVTVAGPGAHPKAPGMGTVVIVGLSSRVPRRITRRVSAATVASAAKRPAKEAKGITGTLELVGMETARTLAVMTVAVGDREARPMNRIADVSKTAKKAFADGAQVLAQATLMRGRVRSAAGTAIAGKKENSGNGKGVSSWTRALVGGLVEGSMAHNDKPDMRSWISLPGQIAVSRFGLTAGTHVVTVRAGISSEVYDVPIVGGRTTVVVALLD